MINLNVRSEYSLLGSVLKLKDYVDFAISNKLFALALTDKNTMFGALHFYQQCLTNNIKPIIGIDIEVTYKDFDNQTQEVTVIARNYFGYQNLCQISSIIMTNENKVINHQDLLLYLKDVTIVIKPASKIIFELESNHQILQDYLKITQVYWGIDKNNLVDAKRYLQQNKTLIPFNLVQYLEATDSDSLRLIIAIREQKLLQEILPIDFINYHYQMDDSWQQRYEGVFKDNLMKLINDIDLKIPLANKEYLLKYQSPNNQKSDQYLAFLCLNRLKELITNQQKYDIYFKRLKYELDTITKMGFADYFLIVWDYVLFARKQNILVGPGRGSAAGSLVAYLLRITAVDPIKYDLIFERFLNPERLSLPDIDIDFPDERREEVINYLFNKYGQEHVAQIITFQTITSKIAIKDTARVLGIEIEVADKISKAIPLDLNFDLQGAVSKIDFLQVMANQYPILFAMANKIVGLPRNFGTHAAGIVLSQVPIQKIAPILKGYNNLYLTQYSMNYLEQLGLLKMDLLGLRNLTIITQILEMIHQEKGTKIDLEKIPLDDKKTYHLLANGATNGIFQLESAGMKQILTTMLPSELEDIVATSSLFRPGPIDYIKTYIKRKLKQEPVVYLHPDLKPILELSYGIIVYQEQILLIVAKIANFSLAKADLLRRAISKKNKTKLKQLEDEFITQAIKNGHSQQIAQQIYNDIMHFADYGFNRSHAIAYSLLGYWMAYLKSNYTLYFLSALLTSVIGSDDKVSQYVKECLIYKIKVLAPSINLSTSYFKTENNNLRFPLTAIKQVGRVFYDSLKQERELNGPYNNYFEFVARMSLYGLNSRILEALIGAGACDDFHLSRKSLKESITTALRYAQLIQVKIDGKITINPKLVSLPIINKTKDSLLDKAREEHKYLGFYLQSHPLSLIKKKLNLEQQIVRLENLTILVNHYIKVLVIINRIKQIKTKKGDYMAFLDVSDEYGSIDVTLFSATYQKYQHFLEENIIVLLEGKVELYNNKIHLILLKLESIKMDSDE